MSRIGRWLPLPVLFAATALLHYFAGTFESEFGRYGDEGMHYVTGLLLRDFALSGQWTHPMDFARQFYVHFPKVALGNWPPGFAMVQAGWELVFGESRVSLLLMLMFEMALLAYAVWRLARPYFTAVVVAAGLAVMIASPLSQAQTAMVMAEIQLALLSLLAMVVWARFLDDPSTRNAVLFALLTVAAIMTKGNAWLLLGAAPLTLLVSGRLLALLRNWRLYLAVGLIALVCVPYTLFTMRIVTQGWDTRQFPGLGYLWLSLGIHLGYAASIAGVPLALLAAAGLCVRLIRARDTFWVAMGCYAVTIIVFHTLVPTSIEPRKVYQIAPVLALGLAAGIDAVAAWLAPRLGSLARPALAAAAVGVFLISGFTWVTPYKPGNGPVVEYLQSRPDTAGAAILLAGNGFMDDSEAALISEWAERSRTSGTYLVRGTKLLGSPVPKGPANMEIEPHFATPEQLESILQGVPVAYIVLDTAHSRRDYLFYQPLRDHLARRPELWEPVMRMIQEGHEFQIYRNRRDLTGQPLKLSVDLTRKIGTTIDAN